MTQWPIILGPAHAIATEDPEAFTAVWVDFLESRTKDFSGDGAVVLAAGRPSGGFTPRKVAAARAKPSNAMNVGEVVVAGAPTTTPRLFQPQPLVAPQVRQVRQVPALTMSELPHEEQI